MFRLFLAQVQESENPTAKIVVGGIFVLLVIWIAVARMRQGKRRGAMRDRASELGWQYSGIEAWQKAEGADFQVVYSYTGTTDGVPWAMLYSRKRRKSASISLSETSASTRRQNQKSDRFDWRSDAVSVPQMVFLKYKMPNFMNQMMAMVDIDVNTYVYHMMNLGLTEADHERRMEMPLAYHLLTKTNPLQLPEIASYGLHSISTFEHPIFELHAASPEAAAQVMNSGALESLAAWEAALGGIYGSSNARHYLYQPMILLYQGGVILNFDSEPNDIAAFEAIVNLGTGLVKSQR